MQMMKGFTFLLLVVATSGAVAAVAHEWWPRPLPPQPAAEQQRKLLQVVDVTASAADVAPGVEDASVDTVHGDVAFETAGAKLPLVKQRPRRCGTKDLPPTAKAAARLQLNLFRAAQANTKAAGVTTAIASQRGAVKFPVTISTYVHIVMRPNGTGNVTDKVIADQMAVLNAKFGRKTGFIFQLMETTRIVNDTVYTSEPTTEAGANLTEAFMAANRRGSAVDLNVFTWRPFGLLGWAYPPFYYADITAAFDGVVINLLSMPSVVAEADWPYGLGYTLVHEVRY